MNPYTSIEWAHIPQASAAQVADAIAAARQAFDTGWKDTNGYTRAKLMHRLADLLDEHAAQMAELEPICAFLDAPVGQDLFERFERAIRCGQYQGSLRR